MIDDVLLFQFENQVLRLWGNINWYMKSIPGARATNGISIEFKIRSELRAIYFKINLIDHNEILHTSRQWYSRGVCKNS